MKLKPSERLPCPFCGNTQIKLLGCAVTELLGDDYADCYCQKCQAKAPQYSWNNRVSQQPAASSGYLPTGHTMREMAKELLKRKEDAMTKYRQAREAGNPNAEFYHGCAKSIQQTLEQFGLGTFLN